MTNRIRRGTAALLVCIATLATGLAPASAEDGGQTCTVTTNDDGTVTLDWTAISGEDRYQVRKLDNTKWVARVHATSYVLGAEHAGDGPFWVRSRQASITDTRCSDDVPPPPPPPPPVDVFASITANVDEFVADQGLNGAGLLIVDRERGVVYEQYFGEFGPERQTLIASASKMISAGVLLKLQEQGLLDMDREIRHQVGWANTWWAHRTTPAQLVSNSSGLLGLGPSLVFPYTCTLLEVGLERCGAKVINTPFDAALVAPADTEYRYGGSQWQVAGAVAETVSGKSWHQLIDEIYVEPCGVDSLRYTNLGFAIPALLQDPIGALLNLNPYPTALNGRPDLLPDSNNPTIEGGAHITAPDYADLLLMHLRGGRCGGTQVLSQQSLDTMHADRIGAVYGGSTEDGSGYGMGWFVDRDTGRISDPGAFGAIPWLDLDDGYGAYLVIEKTTIVGGELKDQIEELVHDAVLASRAG